MTTLQKIQMKLASSRCGRMALHLICFCQDGKLRWHMRGIIRELPKYEAVTRYFTLLLVRPAQPTLNASTFARAVEAVHDTVFLKKQVSSAG